MSKKEKKEMSEVMSCVYKILNKSNGRFYIGSTGKDFSERWNSHISLMVNGKHHNKGLQEDWAKYGLDSFEFVVLEVFDGMIETLQKEKELIERYFDKGNKCYNRTKRVNMGPNNLPSNKTPKEMTYVARVGDTLPYFDRLKDNLENMLSVKLSTSDVIRVALLVADSLTLDELRAHAGRAGR